MPSNLLRRGLVAITAVATMVCVLVAVAHLPFVRSGVFGWGREQIRDAFGIVIDADAIRYNLLTASFELDGVSVGVPGQRPFLQADSIRIVLSRQLYLGTVELQRLEAASPLLAIVRRADGTSNLPAGSNGSSSTAQSLRLGVVDLRQARIELQDEGARRSLDIGPIDLAIDTLAADPSPGSFGPSSFTVRLPDADSSSGRGVLSGTVAGRLGFDGRRVSVRDAHVSAPEGELDLEGSIDVVSNVPSVEGRGQLTLNLAEAARLVGDGGPISGLAQVRFDLEGSLRDPIARMALAGRGLEYRAVTGAELAANATYAAGRLEIERLDITSSLGEAHASGALLLTGDSPAPDASRIVARLAGVDLDTLLDVAALDVPVTLGTRGSGALEAALDGAAIDLGLDDWPQRLSANGRIRLAPEGTGLSLDGQLDVRLDAGRWTVEHTIRSTGARTELRGIASGEIRRAADGGLDSTLALQSALRADELGAVLPVLREAGIELPSAVEDGLVGSLEAALESRGTLLEPRILATVAGRGIQAAAFPAADLDAVAEMDRKAVHLQSAEARLAGARLAASGDYAWNGQASARFEVTADDLATLAESFDLADLQLAGTARAKGAIQGDLRSPRVRADLTGRQLSAYGTRIGTLDATLDLLDRRLTVEARAPDLAVELQGDVDTREPFAYEANAVLDRASIPNLVPVPWRESVSIRDGIVTGTVAARGELRRPFESAGQAAIRALEIDLSGTPIVLETPATVTAGPAEVATTGLDLRIGNQTHVRILGAIARNEALEGLELRLDGALADILAVAAPVVPDLPLAGEGSIGLDLQVGGTLRAPEPQGSIAVRDANLRYGDLPPLTDLMIDGRVERARIELRSADARWQGANVHAEGVLPLRMIVPEPAEPAQPDTRPSWGSDWLASLPEEPRSARLTATFRDVTRDALAPFVESSQLEKVAGAMSASVTVEADALDFERVQGAAVVDSAAFDIGGVPFMQVVPTRLRLEDGFVRVEEFLWSAQGDEVRLSGGVNVADPDLAADLALTGAVDLRILNVLAGGVAFGGIARSDLKVTGPLTSPEVAGRIDVAAGEVQIDTPPLAASDLTGTILTGGDGMATILLAGLVNGGSAELTGSVNLENLEAPIGQARLTARNVTLEFPDGFQTESDADLTMSLQEVGSTLSGRISVLNGIYREPIVFSRGFLADAGRREVVTVSPESPFLSNLRLDVALATAEDVRIDNNYGRLNAAAALRVEGTAERPALVGRIEVQPDGELYLAGNTFRIQNFLVEFNDPRARIPDVTFLADTRVGNVPIEVSLQCADGGTCEREVRSQAAGVTNEEAEAMLFGISSDPAAAGAQLARLLSGEVLGMVGRTVGLDTLRLDQAAGERADLFDDPTLVAGDVNPASRLTVGKRLGERVELAYSQNLADNGFTTTTSYAAPASMSFRALLLDDQSRSYEFRHEPLGGAPRRTRPEAAPPPTIAAVRIGGTPGLPEQDLRARLRLAEGDSFDFTRWQEDRERLNELYRSRGFFEARIRSRRVPVTTQDGRPAQEVPDGEAVVLEYIVEQGPPTRLAVTGVSLPDDVRNRIIDRWSSRVFDRFLERDAVLIVRDYLYGEGRLQASVTALAGSNETDGVKTLRIDVDPGPAMKPSLEFTGNAIVPEATLFEVAEAIGARLAWLDPPSFARAIERVYLDEGMLSAEVEVREPEARDEASVVRVVIEEGEPWQVGRVTLGGAEALTVGNTPEGLGLLEGSRYDPELVEQAIAELERRFREAGFLDARVVSETVLDQERRGVDVHVLAQPGPRSVLTSVVVEGAPADSELIEDLTVGAPVTTSALSDFRRRLYDTGVYRSVEIDLEPADPAAPAGGPEGGDLGVVARVQVQERPRYRFRYGLAFQDDVVGPEEREQRFGFAADLENRNLFGTGTAVGASARLRRDQQVGRLFMGARQFLGLPLRSNVYLSRGREEIGSNAAFPTISDVIELSAEQAYRVRRLLDVRYGYDFGQNRTTSEELNFDLSVKVARFNTTGLVDRRDDPFDPARGWFSSANLEVSREGLGSDINFLRSFFQAFQFAPLGGRGVVLASAARFGVARTYEGEDLIPSERFYAGGATSVRGYRDDDLGPRSLFGDADGGHALLIFNTELRFPVYRWLRSVGFLDLGNVYERLADITDSGLQYSAGGGIRLNTPIGLLRLDIAAPLNPRPDDPKWRFHFGLGHAF